jgi:ribosome biogenesis GTPase A
MEHINWYPGHMKKTRELIEGSLPLVDAVVEVCDARIPVAGRNPVLAELSSSKARFIALTKVDLADRDVTKAWMSAFESEENMRAVAINARTGEGLGALVTALKNADVARPANAKAKAPLRAMIVGVPNSGKSSLINKLTGRKSAAVGNRPGVTRGKQWLTLEGGMQLLDTPGILMPKIEDRETGLKLAWCGSIKDEILDVSDLCLEFIKFIMKAYPEALPGRYELAGTGSTGAVFEESLDADEHLSTKEPAPCIPGEYLNTKEPSPCVPVPSPCVPGASGEHVNTESALVMMESIAVSRGFLMKGNRIDYERAARTVLDEFRSGRLGRISLERPVPR